MKTGAFSVAKSSAEFQCRDEATIIQRNVSRRISTAREEKHRSPPRPSEKTAPGSQSLTKAHRPEIHSHVIRDVQEATRHSPGTPGEYVGHTLLQEAVRNHGRVDLMQKKVSNRGLGLTSALEDVVDLYITIVSYSVGIPVRCQTFSNSSPADGWWAVGSGNFW